MTEPLSPEEEAMVRTRASLRLEDDLIEPPPFVRLAFEDRHRILATLDAARAAQGRGLDVAVLREVCTRLGFRIEGPGGAAMGVPEGRAAKAIAREYAALIEKRSILSGRPR